MTLLTIYDANATLKKGQSKRESNGRRELKDAGSFLGAATTNCREIA